MDFKDIVDPYNGWTIILNSKNTNPQIELRKKFKAGDLFLLVSAGKGYDYKFYSSQPDRWGRFNTHGVNVHMSCNGPIQMSFDDFAELSDVVERAKQYFASLA